MPEWLTHVIFAYLVFKLCSLRYRSLEGADMALVLMGSILLNDDWRAGAIHLAAMLAVVTVLRILKKVCRKT